MASLDKTRLILSVEEKMMVWHWEAKTEKREKAACNITT